MALATDLSQDQSLTLKTLTLNVDRAAPRIAVWLMLQV